MPEQTRKKILMVEDDHDIRMGVSLRLKAQGYQVEQAGDGFGCLELAESWCPDLILMDVRMPRLDGLAALRSLRENAVTADIPVVMLSASVVDLEDALDAGACYFLAKPFESEQLRKVISATLSV